MTCSIAFVLPRVISLATACAYEDASEAHWQAESSQCPYDEAIARDCATWHHQLAALDEALGYWEWDGEDLHTVICFPNPLPDPDMLF
jgi:hypothetical protein